VDGERYVSEVAGRTSRVTKKAGIGVIIAGGAIMCAVVLLAGNRGSQKVAAEPKLSVHSEVSYVPPPPPPPAPPAQVASLTPDASLPTLPGNPITAAIEGEHKDTKLLIFTSGSGRGNNAAASAPPPSGNGVDCESVRRRRDSGAFDGGGPCDYGYGYGGPDGYGYGGPGPFGAYGGFQPVTAAERLASRETLGARLRPTVMEGATATVLQHQPFLLTQGTMIPCILQTAMNSSLPGLVVCVVPQDVQGKTGITLLDRGTKVVGEFKGGVRQGIERMFVTWTRAEAPQGVIISMDSPGTDPLGRSGLDGEVDYHFWQRFGGALLISVVDGAIETGVALASKSGTTTINTGASESVVTSILQDSINIPPTIMKHQGELVSILVARDLDFSGVYGVIKARYAGMGWAPARPVPGPGPVPRVTK